MSYKRPRLKLTFEHEEFDGLEVLAKRISIGKIFEIVKLASMKEDLGLEEMEPQFTSLIEKLSKCLIKWNLMDDNPDDPDGPDIPVPTTVEGLKSQDLPLILALVEQLAEASTGVPTPLQKSSSGGEASLAELPVTELV